MYTEYGTAYTFTTGPNSTWLPTYTLRKASPILREEVEAAVKTLKMGKSAVVDNIPAELVQVGGEATPQSATRFWRQVSGRPHGLNKWLSHSQRKATSSCARTTEHYWPFQGGTSVVVHIYLCHHIYNVCLLHDFVATGDPNAVCIALCIVFCFVQANSVTTSLQCKKISNDQELIQSDPISCPQNQKGNN